MKTLASPDESVATRLRLYTVAEAATALRISPSHLYAMIEQQRVAGVVRIGRVIRINLDALLATQGAADAS